MNNDQLPATFGGNTFSYRQNNTSPWQSHGVNCEYGLLMRVLLAAPSNVIKNIGDDFDSHLFLRQINYEKLDEEVGRVAEFYRSHDITVDLIDADDHTFSNIIFMRDTFAMTPFGAIVSRMASSVRAGEESIVLQKLASLNIPVLLTIAGEGIFEGADLIWINETKALLGVGKRTNHHAYKQINAIFESLGVTLTPLNLPEGTQHLLGVVNIIDHNLAIVRESFLTSEIELVLRKLGIDLIRLADNLETTNLRANNVVALGPRKVVMSSGCQETKIQLEQYGVEVYELAIEEILACGGGLGCLTGKVESCAKKSD